MTALPPCVYFQKLAARLKSGVAVVCFFGGIMLTQAQTEYTADGEPSAIEEEIRWLLNRARFDRARENALRGTSYTDIPASTGPVAPNALLLRSSRHHSEDMARKNVFQHKTVNGSLFYNPATHPNPWDRMTAEGYVWNMAAENIAAGYASALSVHVGWWKSTGHRLNMGGKDMCEIGNGYHYRAGTTYVEYYTMNLGRSGNNRFFTGTIFDDTNGNRAYSRNEGRGGIRVDLAAGGLNHSWCDVSTSVGSFAIPLDGISAGTEVHVLLTNTNPGAVALSLPRDYDTLEKFVLGPGESRVWGKFTRDASDSATPLPFWPIWRRHPCRAFTVMRRHPLPWR